MLAKAKHLRSRRIPRHPAIAAASQGILAGEVELLFPLFTLYI
jgi:hypothetical protein